jgi:hypothetical protein
MHRCDPFGFGHRARQFWLEMEEMAVPDGAIFFEATRKNAGETER